MISKATITDAAALTRLVNSGYRGEVSKQGWTTEADLLGGIRTDEAAINDMIRKPGSVILKYESGGELRGCVNLEKQNEKLYLGMLTVAPHLQNNGLGKLLLRAAEAYARDQQCTAIVMSVISVRHELIRWYERHGYRQTGASKSFPMDDQRFGIPKQHLEFLILEKQLVR
jgi:ribosomal protein S18 acetylase RimI-like enzyme